MPHDADPRLAELRAEVDKAIRAFVSYKAEVGGYGDAIVHGWAAYAEYQSVELYARDESGNVVIVPDDQNAATSRGLFSFGVDAFSR